MQVKMIAFGLVASLGGGAWFVSASPSGEFYPMPRHEVASRLATAPPPGGISQGYSDDDGGAAIVVSKRGISQVVWAFSAADQPLAKITADLEPDGAGTRVTVNFAMADSELAGAVSKDIGGAREMLEGIITLGMTEHVDATLERRAFDDQKVARSVAMYAAKNPGAAKRYMETVKAIESGEAGSSATQDELARLRAEKREAAESSPDREFVAEDPTPPDDYAPE